VSLVLPFSLLGPWSLAEPLPLRAGAEILNKLADVRSELALLPPSSGSILSSAASSSSLRTQLSQRPQPSIVPKLPQPTTLTGLSRSWKMPTKQQTNIATEQTCWTMTVESATRGQKS
jgi:hypothetical protein